MKNLKISWKLVALFVLGGIGSFFYVTRSRAFTLIELQLLPAVQLLPGQSAIIAVSNTSSNDVDATMSAYRANGTLLKQRTVTLAPGTTQTLVVIAGTDSQIFRTAIALSASQSAVSDVELLDKTTGQVTAVLLPAVQ